MKALLSLSSFISLILFSLFLSYSSPLRATLATTTCGSAIGTNRELVLIFVDQDLKRMRIHSLGTLPKLVDLDKISKPNMGGYTLYAFADSFSPLEVENSVLMGKPGTLHLGDDVFACGD